MASSKALIALPSCSTQCCSFRRPQFSHGHLGDSNARKTVRTPLHNGTRKLVPRFSPGIPNGSWVFLRCNSPMLCRSTSTEEEEADTAAIVAGGAGGNGGDNGDDGEDEGNGAKNLISNAPVYVLWAGLIAYAILGAPNQTPYRDQLFLEKLLLLRGDDGFPLNPVLVSVFFIMGVLPVMYSMLLIPTGRSEKGGVPVWPFSVVSFFVGIFALLPYFGLWNPPPPRVSREELSKWPLVVLESKIFTAFIAASGVALVARAALCDSEIWAEYFRFFRESRFIHVMTIDFVLLSLLVVFWVFNDITFRKWSNGSWLLPLSAVPVVGPALYLLLRPRLPDEMISSDE